MYETVRIVINDQRRVIKRKKKLVTYIKIYLYRELSKGFVGQDRGQTKIEA